MRVNVNLRFTHQDIASALSITRVIFTRALGQLRDEGWLQIDASSHLVVISTDQRLNASKKADIAAGS